MKTFLDIYKDFYVSDLVNHWAFALLVFIVILDIFLGMAKAWVTGTYKSAIARKGLVSHGALLLIAFAIYPWTAEVGFSALADTLLVFFCLSYISSVIGNLEALGVPMPEWLKAKLAAEIESKDKGEMK